MLMSGTAHGRRPSLHHNRLRGAEQEDRQRETQPSWEKEIGRAELTSAGMSFSELGVAIECSRLGNCISMLQSWTIIRVGRSRCGTGGGRW